jgi:hypothetical protein
LRGRRPGPIGPFQCTCSSALLRSPVCAEASCQRTSAVVTGNPGVRQASAVAAELARRGFMAIDPDCDPELSHWRDSAGRRVDRLNGPAGPSAEWLCSHRRVWNRRRLQEPLATSGTPVFVCGTAVNQDEILDLFTMVFLLRIDARAQEGRLAAHDSARPPGRDEAERQEIREGRPIFESQILRLGATPAMARGRRRASWTKYSGTSRVCKAPSPLEAP